MKKKKKNIVAQIMAWLALFAIVIWIVGTWVLVLFSSWEQSWHGSQEPAVLNQEDLQRIIDQASVEVKGQPVEGDIEVILEDTDSDTTE